MQPKLKPLRNLRGLMRLLIAPCLMLAASTALTAEPDCEPAPLNILLTNDDGYDTPGIIALHRALNLAGHRVKRVAPAENQSGSSTSLRFDAVTVAEVADEEFDEVYAVSATPATTVVLGATALFSAQEPVDLVVSGINQGANLGPATPISGTVGAVISALQMLQPPIPGIAISSNLIGENPQSEDNVQLAGRISAFVARLIGVLQNQSCGETRILPQGLALNVNYPPLAEADIKGVRLATQGRSPYFRLSFQAAEGGLYLPVFAGPEPLADVTLADTGLFNAGHITIVPIDGDYTAPGANTHPQLDFLESLTP
jgi:5'/3'-nucleotidase SurE